MRERCEEHVVEPRSAKGESELSGEDTADNPEDACVLN